MPQRKPSAKPSTLLLHFKILSIVLGILVVVLSYTSWKLMQSPKPPVELFFTQTAQSAEIALEGNGNNVYHITLDKVPDKVSFISNSPYRDFGTVSTTTFVEFLKHEFAKDYPNASLVGYDPSGTVHSYKIEIVDALYNSSAKQLIYTVRMLSSQPPAADLSDTTLFIDSIALSFINQSNTNNPDIVIFQKN